MPAELYGVKAVDVHAKIKLLIDGLVNITDTTGEFLMTLEDGRVIDTKGWNDWEWTHGIGLLGLWQYYELTGEAEYLAIIENWFRDRFAAGGTTKNINTMAVFLTLAYVYERTQNETYRPWLDSWAEWAYHDLPRTRYRGFQHITYLEVNKDQLWDDTLMMTVLPLAKIGRVLGRPHYVAEAQRQFLLHVQYLCDRPTGLFFHGWEFTQDQKGSSSSTTGHNFANARWARGNSWVTMVIPEFLELLEPDANSANADAIGLFLRDVLDAQCNALTKLQDPSGLWRTLLDVSVEEGSYLEASATAGFAYGMLKARRKRYWTGNTESAISAVKAVLDNVDERGELLNTSFGTGMGHDLQHYKDIPVTSMPYGQAMAIMALVEFLREFM
ncbi:unsaturated rhamnogalacturonyl hydrolase [Sporothrix schenckii 1099-18]|uniref:Unsaturated rhamnogalacturonyl hydrolase n=1 Tax=Sporothrix schenckii 1099-18 TaxID=1397361 RepID=A0A0F2LTW8_SPOSC|nr:unsaturated rhamnogalacturonyl hydrolase [Sporothrix schenckii 1099-18]KJR79940.1 unsaturated rhamnogalacturonyl hydrolase [Sporothrix schenckii 1099-18]